MVYFFTKNHYLCPVFTKQNLFSMRGFKTVIVSLLCSSAMFFTTMAQPLLKCTEYKSGGEMDHSRVSCYLQDSKGLIWFGTWIGLCRYDGKEFYYFRNNNEESSAGKQVPLGSNRILKMVLDSHENIWCQNYDAGLYRFDRNTSTYQSVLPLVKDYPAAQALKDKAYVMLQNQAVWVSLVDGTLVRFNDSDPTINEILPCSAAQKNRTLFEAQEDSKGREWILTDQGVYLHGSGWISSYPFSRFIEEEGHCLLASTSTAQMVEYCNDGQFRSITLPRQVRKIYFFQSLGNGLVSISTDTGLVIYDTRSETMRLISRTFDDKPIGQVGRVVRDSKARIWFFTEGTVLYCVRPGDEKACALYNPEKPLDALNEGGKLHLITEDINGIIWAKPLDGELCYVCEEDFKLHSHRECMPNNRSLPIRDYSFYFVDNQKNLWLSSGTKLYQLTFGRRQFRPIFAKSDAEVRSLLVDDSLHVLCGDKSGLLNRYDLTTGQCQYLNSKGQWTNTPCVFNNGGIYCLYRDQKGNVWVGTRGSGIYRLTPAGLGYDVAHYYNQGDEYDINCDDIYDIYEDENHHFWIATFGGGLNLLEEMPDGTVRFVHAGNELLGFPVNTFDVVRTICGDGKGRLLAGTNKGLLAFTSKFERYSELAFHVYQAQDQMEKPLQDNMVMRVLCDSVGTFYVSTYGRGLSRVDGSTLSDLSFHALPNREFPAGDTNISALMQRTGAVWTVAECGVTCYSPRQNAMWYFDERDFDQPYPLTECAPVEMPDGQLVMGMFGGLFVFPSDDLHKSLYSPKIVFTERLYANGSMQHEEVFNDIDTLVVLPHQRSTSLGFAALDYVPSRLIRYAYWMHPEDAGQEPLWVYTATPEVNFTNLAPGKYQLHIHSTNNDGIWRNNFRVLTIVVVPTFWEKWGWLINLTWIVLLAGSALALYLRYLRKRQQQVVKQEVAATKIEILSRPMEQNDQEFVKRLLGVLEKHLSDGELQVNDLADELNMSRATFYRRLKQSFDMSPNDFIHQVRMRRSIEMLTSTDDTVAQIAYAVGFNNPKYFSKCFRQDFGVTPAEYRNRNRRKNNSPENECEEIMPV